MPETELVKRHNLSMGEREREKTRGERRSRDSKRPHRGTRKIMLKLILTMTASKNTGPENPLMVPMRRRPGIDKSFKDRSPDAQSACFKAPSIFLKFQISEGTGLAWEEGVMGTARAFSVCVLLS